ncbi:MAG: glycosyltransferase family 4 protein [Bacteroidales bacterium]
MELRVLHVLGSLSIGGAENLVLDMVRHGKECGITFHIVYMHEAPLERVKQFSGSGVPLQYIGCGKGVGATAHFISGLRKYIRSNHIQIVHCHNNIDAYWAFLAARRLSCRIVLSVHGFNLNFNYLQKKIRTGAFFHPDDFILRHCSLAFVSGRTKDFYCGEYAGRSFVETAPVIHNGIDAEKILLAERIILTDQDKIVPVNKGEIKPLFAMVGSFNSPARRQQLIICRAIGELKKRFEGELPFRFAFIGASNSGWKGEDIVAAAGKERDVLQSGLGQGGTILSTNVAQEQKRNGSEDMYAACRMYCKEHELDGDVLFVAPRTDVPGIMRGLQCYVYASEDDTFGLSVIEAVLAGVPVLCSDIPTFREVTLDGSLATLVVNTPEAFAEAVFEFMDSPKGEVALEQKKQTALEKYSITACLLHYKELYEK